VEIREISNKQEWENFAEKCVEKTFLQSWNWGDFNLANNSKIWRYGIYSNANLVSVCLVIKVQAKRGTFFYIPHGPVMQENLETTDKKEILQLILLELSTMAKAEGASFIRVSPILQRTEENQNIFWDLNFRESPMPASAYEATWKLDIFAPEEQLLADMRKTTRYLIKKTAENNDIEIIKTADPQNIEIYQKLNKEVSKRQGFVPFSEKFIKNEFEIFNKENNVLFLFGRYKGEVVAGAMIIFWSGTAFYHQAASLGKFSKLSIPYLLQWEAIKEAKQKNCTTYDFWGFTDPEKYPKHPWAGPTLFKMGFGGYKKEYIVTQDYILSSKYWINFIIEKFRRILRGV
jgi:lipid II:glycine glycyltransferase (peptidoglycan interpeptide bridge formation enzyme)